MSEVVQFRESMLLTTSHSHPTQRDQRVDLLRGLALLAVFIDHIPGDALQLLTLQSHALSDAADVFVFLAGYSAWLAYSRLIAREGAWAGLRRVYIRCGRVYAMQVLILASYFAIVPLWVRLAPIDLGLVAPTGWAVFARTFILYAQPTYFGVLPLYVCLLMAFPLLRAGLCRCPRVTVAASAGLWLLVNLNPEINLPEWFGGGGWIFNPFEWQFLFTLGAVAAALNTTWRRPLRPVPRVTALCWIILAEGWLLVRYVSSSPQDSMAVHMPVPMDTVPHLLRILSGLAIMYLALTSTWFAQLARSGRLLAIEVCGKHSLALFGFGSILSLLGRLTFRTAGDGVLVQALVNGIGISILIATADLLERRRQEARTPRLFTPRAASATVGS